MSLVRQAEHRRILTVEEVEFDSLTQDLSEQNAELQRRLGEAVRSSGGAHASHQEDSFPQGTAPAENAIHSPASLRTEFTGKATSAIPDPYQVPDELKDLFAGPHAFPISSGSATPREGPATSSKDVHDVAADKPSPEALLAKALQSMMGKSDDDGKPKAKEAETIQLLDFPTPETYHSLLAKRFVPLPTAQMRHLLGHRQFMQRISRWKVCGIQANFSR